MDALIEVLERSASKHGHDTPLTIGHLLNIAKMARLVEDLEEQKEYENEQEAFNVAFQKTYDNG